MRKIVQVAILAILILGARAAKAQEFNLNVTVSAPNVTTADPKLFKALEEQIRELMNTTSWTEDNFEDHERIAGNIQVTIKEELSATSFSGEIVVQTSRPVYNATYATPTMRYLDRNISFSYDGLRPLQKTEDGYVDNFSSILSFYAYYMLGMDYDSFSSLGGDPYFEKAFNIYNNLPSSIQRGDQGWTSDDNKQQNRYYLLENVRSPRFRRFREAFYSYHRQGIDKMFDNFEDSRKIMLEAITDVGRVNKEVNNSILTRMFSDTKRLEIIDVFLVANADQKTKVRSIMMGIDPSQSNAYRDLR